MKSLLDYLVEAKFQNTEFYKHNYAKDVIKQLIETGKIRLGTNGEREYVIPDDIFYNVKKELLDIVDNPEQEKFNEILLKYKLFKFNEIFKGDFSGYSNGLASKNRGSAFEQDYVNNFSKYSPALIDVLKLNADSFENCVPTSVGNKNQKRPLEIKDKKVIVGGKHSTVGESIVDVYVNDKNGNNYNLSLKYGSTVSFCNIGISRIFTKRSFDEYKIKHEYNAETFNGINGNDLLDFFFIDKNKFANIFTTYKSSKKR